MSWLDLPRVPEREVMDDSDEVQAYSSAAGQAYLDKLDDTLVAHAERLVAAQPRGRGLDIGTGPGQIVLKLAARLTEWEWVGVDRSPNMIAQALTNLAARAVQGTAGIDRRVLFLVADGNRLNFPDASFDLVMCNSVLHHLADPQRVLGEVARLVKPGGAVLIRDLRRPSRLAYPLHVRWFGRHYSGVMYRLFCASVRAAYTPAEIERVLRASALAAPGPHGVRARVFTHERTHLGVERPISA